MFSPGFHIISIELYSILKRRNSRLVLCTGRAKKVKHQYTCLQIFVKPTEIFRETIGDRSAYII